VVLVVVVVACIVPAVIGSEWDYNFAGNEGPSNWPGICQTGKRQSPVNVHTQSYWWWPGWMGRWLAPPCERQQLQLVGLNIAPRNLTVVDNGHTVMLSNFNNIDSVQLHNFPGSNGVPYVLMQIHFHWAQIDWRGSEHQFNGQYFPLEMHMVFKLATAPADPTNTPNGMAVVSVMFQRGYYDNPGLTPLVAIMETIKNKKVSQVTTNNDHTPLKAIFELPSHFNDLHFMHYPGSLTTPGCNEVVNWFVYTHQPTVSESQLNKFRRDILDVNLNRITNDRPMQNLNGRQFTPYCGRFLN